MNKDQIESWDFDGTWYPIRFLPTGGSMGDYFPTGGTIGG